MGLRLSRKITKLQNNFMSKKVRSAKGTASQILQGVLDISKSGTGFVSVDGLDKDILIKPHELGRAFHGDTVNVMVPAKAGLSDKRVEGVITEVLQRKQLVFTGSLHSNNSIAFFIPGGDKSMPDFFIPPHKLSGAKNGDKVVAKFVKWNKSDKKPEGEIVAVIDAQNASDLAMKELLLNNNFPLTFDPAVMEEAKKLSPDITREETRKRKDFRDILTFTIDPVDAKDFDDALSIRNLDNGCYEIGVHIADISHFVKPDSALDKEAYARATSVYLPDRVNPMLPEKISNELCSLRPNEDKYTFSAVFQVTNIAEIKHKWIGRTLIHSNHRFTYEEVQQIIETKDGLHFKALLLLNDLAQRMRKERLSSGAINFSSQEVRFKLDDTGKPIGIEIKESFEAHQLVEEFMLLANKTVAEYVSKIKINKQPIPFPYRVHDKPDEDKLTPFAAFARKFGYSFNMKDEREVAFSFNKLLQDVHGRPEQHVLEQLGIRTMAKAVYTTQNIGHYGLGFENYCHFTSPIRRYPDVMVHRILQHCLDKDLKTDKLMEEKCKHCSERERSAMDCERNANKYKQVEFMQQFLGDEFDAIISGVSPFGFWAETQEHKCEGFVSIRELNLLDEFRHNEAEYALVGQKTKRKFRMGDKVKIKVAATNLEKRQMDFELVQEIKVPVKKAVSKKKISKRSKS